MNTLEFVFTIFAESLASQTISTTCTVVNVEKIGWINLFLRVSMAIILVVLFVLLAAWNKEILICMDWLTCNCWNYVVKKSESLRSWITTGKKDLTKEPMP